MIASQAYLCWCTGRLTRRLERGRARGNLGGRSAWTARPPLGTSRGRGNFGPNSITPRSAGILRRYPEEGTAVTVDLPSVVRLDVLHDGYSLCAVGIRVLAAAVGDAKAKDDLLGLVLEHVVGKVVIDECRTVGALPTVGEAVQYWACISIVELRTSITWIKHRHGESRFAFCGLEKLRRPSFRSFHPIENTTKLT